MGPNQTYKLLHIKETINKVKKDNLWNEKIFAKQRKLTRLNFQNIQTDHIT